MDTLDEEQSNFQGSTADDVISLAASQDDDFVLVDPATAAATKDSNLDAVRKWLAPTDYFAESGEYRRHLSVRAPDTGLWVCDTEAFRQWQASPSYGCLWIKGAPGAGKSVIAASVIAHLAEQEPSTPLLFFFFRHIIDANRRQRCMLRDWLAQLLPHSPLLQESLSALTESPLESVPDQALWDCLYKAASLLPRLVCIVDAMDEMEDVGSTDFFQRINGLFRLPPDTAKLLVTSRPRQDIQAHLLGPAVVHISLEKDSVSRDIQAFATHRMRAMVGGDALASAVTARSAGLFLYARLLVDQIAPLVERSLPVDLDVLPLGLTDLYDGLLKKQAQETNISQDIQAFLLGCVTHSLRPLRLRELGFLCNHHMGSSMSPAAAKTFVKTACGPLLEVLDDETVQIIHHSLTEFLLDGNRRTMFPLLDPKLVHRQLALVCISMIQEQFDTGEHMLRPLVGYALEAWTFHASYDTQISDDAFLKTLTAFCRRMCRPHDYTPRKPRDIDRKWRRDIAWARQGPSSIDGFHSLSMTPLQFASYYGLCRYAETLVNTGDLEAELSLFTQNPTSVRFEHQFRLMDYPAFPSVWWGCYGGHRDVVQLLLDNIDLETATPSTQVLHKWKFDILRATLCMHHASVLEHLLNRGLVSFPAAIGIYEACTLFFLFDAACTSVALPYLDEDQIDLLLCTAAARGDDGSVRAILADPRANPNAFIGGVKPLYLGCAGISFPVLYKYPSTDCIKLLLDAGAHPAGLNTYGSKPDIDSREPLYKLGHGAAKSTALHGLATSWTNQTHETCLGIMRILLQAGAELDARDENGRTPLAVLLSWPRGSRIIDGHDPLDKFNVEKPCIVLLEHGADAQAQTNESVSILRMLLRSHNSPKLVAMLLQQGADATEQLVIGPERLSLFSDLRAPAYMPDLSASAMADIQRMHEVARALAAHGASIDVDSGGDALGQAVRRHDIEMTQILLSTCKENNKALRNSLLSMCSGRGRSMLPPDLTAEFLTMLLEAGASLDESREDGVTPLLLAASKLDTSLAMLLLKKGANRDSVDRDGNGALHWLIKGFHGSDENVKLAELLETFVSLGFDPLKTNAKGESLLHAYIAVAWNRVGTRMTVSEHWETVKQVIVKLLELGISPRLKCRSGSTAVHRIIQEPTEGSGGSWVCELSAHTVLLANFLELCQSTSEGIDIDAKDNKGFTALHLAAMSDMEDSAQSLDVLLTHGADLNIRTPEGDTALHLACRARNASTVSLLLARSNGSLLEANDNDDRWTPLFEACRSAVPEIVAQLLNAGADVEAMDVDGMTPLHACAEAMGRRSDADVNHQMLLDRGISSVTFGHHRSNVCFASRNIGNLDVAIYSVASMLIDAGADPLRKGNDRDRQSSLTCAADHACQHSCYGMMMALKGRGLAPTNALFAAKWSIMERPGLATRQFEPMALQDILSHPQRYLSLYRPEDMDWLVQVKANLHSFILDDTMPPNQRYFSTRGIAGMPSFVQQVIHHGQTAFMKRLLSEVKHYESRNSRLSTQDIAVLAALSPEEPSDREWTLGTLVEMCPQLVVRPLVYEACCRNSPNLLMIKLFVEQGEADVNARIISDWDSSNSSDDGASSVCGLPSEYGEYEDTGADTALGYMAFQQDYWHLEAIRYLVENGADINVRDRYGKTPLMMACRPVIRRAVGWTLEFVRVLLELGADPTICDDSGRSCLDWAQRIDTLRVLISNGADLASSAASLVQRSVEDLDVDLVKLVLSNCQVDLNAALEDRKPRWTLFDNILGSAGEYEHIYTSTLPLVGALFFQPEWIATQNRQSDTPARRWRRKAMVEVLLDHGASPFVALSNGASLLHSLVRHALLDDDLFSLFLARQPPLDLETIDCEGSTLLLEACGYDDGGVLELSRDRHLERPEVLYETSRAEIHLKLIKAGADVNVVNARGEQVLHMMLSSPWMPSQFILEFLRQPQGRKQAFSETASGYSALHYALSMLRPDICTELLRMGVSPQIRFQDESGPLSYIALQCLDKRIWQQKLSGHNHDPPWDSWGAKREAGHTEACLSLWEGFVAAGHDVDARDRLGCPPLFNFLRWVDPHAYQGSLRPLEAHLAAKPDGGRDGERGSASRRVGESEPLNLVWFDAFFGTADLHATDNTGTTALHVVASLPVQFGAANTFQYLVNKGGLDPLTEDHLGRSSLDVAAETGKEEVLELFRQRKG